jgi:hypothetical protein
MAERRRAENAATVAARVEQLAPAIGLVELIQRWGAEARAALRP